MNFLRFVGSPEARAQELINATTCAVYDRVSSMMFERHVELFSLLVVLERLRMSQQLSNEELALFINGVDTSAIEGAMSSADKPNWLTKKV